MRRILFGIAAGVLTLGGFVIAAAPASAQLICPPVVVQAPVVAPVIVQPEFIRPIVRPVIVRHPVYRRRVVRGWHWHYRR